MTAPNRPSVRSWKPHPDDHAPAPLRLTTLGTAAVLLGLLVALCAALVIGQAKRPDPDWCAKNAEPGYVAQCRAQTGQQP